MALLAGCAAPERPADLLLVVSDALRADAVDCTGAPARTPNICRLAARGARFTDASANASWTLASAVTMATGNPAAQYALPAESGRIRFQVPDDELLLAEALAAAGYDAVRYVENPLADRASLRQGFVDGPPPPQAAAPPASGAGPEGLDPRLGFDAAEKRNRELAPVLRYLAADTGRRFFVLVWLFDPHAEYDPPAKYLAPLAERAADLPHPLDYYRKLGHGNHPEQGRFNLRRAAAELAPEELALLRDLYLAEVASVDERVGYLLGALRLSGREDDTLVVFTSDHGEGFGEHGRFLHGDSLYQELLRVPLIFAGPGVRPGLVIDRPVSHVDLMPTLAEMLGADCLAEPRGRSLAPLLAGGDAPGLGRRARYLDGPPQAEIADGLVHGGFKLIAGDGDRTSELYDLASDPGETVDLAGARPEVRDALFRRLRRVRAEIARRRLLTEAAGAADAESEEEVLRALRALGYVD